MDAKAVSRFWSKVDKSGSCWIWTGCLRSANGYGLFSIGRRNVSAHRFAYEILNGPIPEGASILHSCDNKKCVNPSHLTAGNQSQNIKDCVKRGRHIAPAGERNGMAKLNRAQVEALRAEYSPARGSLTALAGKFGVSVATVHAIINKKRWR
jgi:hypothetical protein